MQSVCFVISPIQLSRFSKDLRSVIEYTRSAPGGGRLGEKGEGGRKTRRGRTMSSAVEASCDCSEALLTSCMNKCKVLIPKTQGESIAEG